MSRLSVWFFALFPCFFLSLRAAAQEEAQAMLIDRESRISFFSAAPLENISATTEKAASALQLSTNEIAFKVPIKSFMFRKALMQEHFNENYLESDQFPYATFSGKVNGPVDWDQEGTYAVTASGSLEIHGVKKSYTTPATVEVKGNLITARAKFNIRLADHNIKIPRVVIKNIAEVVEVDVFTTYRKK